MENFKPSPSGQERKKVIKENEENIAHFKKVGKRKILEKGHYVFVDSPLDGYTEDAPFSASFDKVLPEGEENLRNYIEKTLKEKEGKAIGVEFGGIGSELFAGFSNNFFEKSFGVSLVDHRPYHRLSLLKASDKKINHTFLKGDIYSDKTYETLEKKLKGRKVDLIIERMAKGLEFTPLEPYTVSKILQIWYKLLDEGGLMLIQTPTSFNNLLELWVDKIEKEFNGKLEIQYSIGEQDVSLDCSSFRLIKRQGAPEEIPLLDPRTVSKIPRWY